MNQPVFITGAERSGSTLIARILQICGVFIGEASDMYENDQIYGICYDYLPKGPIMPDVEDMVIPVNWRTRVGKILRSEGYEDGLWLFKSSLIVRMWPVWYHAYPDAHWIIVRRRTEDIIQSCIKTGHMIMFKDRDNQKFVHADCEAAGWRNWVEQYERRFVQVIEAGADCKVVWPERMCKGNYQPIYEMLKWLGLAWQSEILNALADGIDPLLTKSRK